MRALAVVVVVASLLALAQAGWAANLDSSWYVKLGLVAFFGPASGGGTWGIGWDFTSPPEATGPFQVTQPDPLWPQRMISVPTAAYGVPAGTAVWLHGQPEAPITSPATDLQITHETNYDSSQMLVQLYVQHQDGASQLLWTEPRSGYHLGTNSVLQPYQSILPTDAIYFKVVTVPEPCQPLALAAFTLGLLRIRRRSLR